MYKRQGLACVREAQKAGQPVIAETCPQYLLLDESAYAERDGLKYICLLYTSSSRTPTAAGGAWSLRPSLAKSLNWTP